MFSALARSGMGTRSVIGGPYPSSPTRLAGLLVSSRIDENSEVDEDLRTPMP